MGRASGSRPARARCDSGASTSASARKPLQGPTLGRVVSAKKGGPSTRERILDVALDLFAEEGFSGTTITAVEKRVGLTPGTGSFYRHFPSKEALLAAAVDREVERCMADISEARSSPVEVDAPPQQQLRGREPALRDIRRFDRLFRLLLREGDRVPEVRDTIAAALQGPGEQLSWRDS